SSQAEHARCSESSASFSSGSGASGAPSVFAITRSATRSACTSKGSLGWLMAGNWFPDFFCTSSAHSSHWRDNKDSLLLEKDEARFLDKCIAGSAASDCSTRITLAL